MTDAVGETRPIRQPAVLNSLKTHCQMGHEFAGDNLRVVTKRGRSARMCVTCTRQKARDASRAALIAAHPDAPSAHLLLDDILPADVWKRIEVNPQSECWEWRGSLGRQGYGRTTHGTGQTRYALVHRFVYEQLVGKVPDGLELDHLCRVRHCCNPEHLEPVTHRENMLRGDTFAARLSRATHCKHGHEFTTENVRVNARGHRTCIPCARIARRARHLRDMAAKR